MTYVYYLCLLFLVAPLLSPNLSLTWESHCKRSLEIPCLMYSTTKDCNDSWQAIKGWIERFHWCNALLQHGCCIAQTDLDIQGSHAHHARTRSSCAWTTNGEVHGGTVTHNNVKRCLHKWILISIAIEAAVLEDSMMPHENTIIDIYSYNYIWLIFGNSSSNIWIYVYL